MIAKLLFRPASAAFWTAAVLAFLAGCPDPDATYDRFLKDTEDRRSTGAGGAIDGQGIHPVDGRYFLTISANLSPTQPLIFVAESTFTANPQTGGGHIDLKINPVVSDVPATPDVCDEPRTLAPAHPEDTDGNPVIEVGTDIAPDGNFSLDFGPQRVQGCANSLTGANIRIDYLTLNGTTKSEDRFCGNIDGRLAEPYPARLTGSFAFVKICERADPLPPGDTWGPADFSCPDEGAGGTGGTGGAGGTGGGGGTGGDGA